MEQILGSPCLAKAAVGAPLANSIEHSPPTAAPAQPRHVIERTAPRHELTIIGRIFTSVGSRDVTIRDLSETGCHFLDLASELRPETRLTIRIGTIGPIEATVRWRKNQSVGIQFRTALYPSVFQHICDQFDLRKR
ncbi:PilZ domain-containing protein [Tsuneonella deserti]|uniref:PilZ domain-containing protein n=1 Tax=Tsuneonella deserti TaxID=2035528 RepID=UPI003570B17E